ATYKQDFIELFNRGNVAVNISGWTLQYASAAGTTWQVTNLSGTIPAGGYYLIQQAAGTGTQGNLPTPDATGTIAMGASAGKVALVSTSAALTGSGCPFGANVVDFVGFGTTANCFEGAGPTPAPSNTLGVIRNGAGCTETDANSTDFVLAAVNPRNSATTHSPCMVVGGSPTLSINDVSLSEGNSGTTTFTFTVSLSAPAGVGGVTFNIATANGTATAGSDYVAKSLSAQTIPQGQSSYVFSVDVNGDTNMEPNETFTVNVTGIMGASNTIASATGTIVSDEVFRIYDVQGNGTASPFAGSALSVEGIVTFVSQGTNSLGGFFIQEPDINADADPATSEGIFVFTNAAPAMVSVGNRVRVNGTVTEFGTAPNTLTEIVTPTVTTLSTGHPLPSLITVSLPVATVGDLERYEGMRVRFNQTLTVSNHFDLMQYGEITVTANGRAVQPTNFIDPNDDPASGTSSSGASNGAAITAEANRIARSSLIIDGAFTTYAATIPFLDPMTNSIRLGSTVSDVTGVLSQIGGTHRVYPEVAPVFTYAARPATPPAVGGNLTVASMNVLNYFNGDGAGGGFPTSRGADSPAEFNRQRAKVLSAILGLNADVVGLLEVENDGNGATSAIQDLVNGLNATAGAGTWAFIPDPAGYGSTPGGTDAIRPAIIYKTAKVAPDGASQTSTDSAFSNARSPVAQAFTLLNNGEKFTLVVNHFKSKSSSGATGADADQGDGQGAFNAARKSQAQALIGFINALAMTTPRVIAMGDFNAYAQEDPLDILRAAGLQQLVSSDTAYMFGGQSGALDHAFGTAALQTTMTGSGHWHINADEPILLDYNVENKNTSGCVTGCTSPDLYAASPYRSSDHDPVLVGLQLGANVCFPGTYSMSGNEPCTAASPGKFVSGAGATIQIDCAQGTYQPMSGATACLPATPGNFVGMTGSSTQSPCAPGTYSNASGASQCTPASPGSFVGTGGAIAQVPCDPGKFSSSSGAISCDPASPGFFVAASGASVQSACLPGTYQPNAGQVSCLLADAGSFVAGSSATMQQPCQPGSFSANTGAAACTPATPGSIVSGSGATAQMPCLAGTYQPNSAATLCLPADAGSFVGSEGSATQTPCTAGSYSNTTGASACTPASPGNFVASSGAMNQTPCVPGTYQAASGAASCTPASVGFFVASSGAILQTPCAIGTTTLVEGATMCIPLFTVTPGASANGSISPNTAVQVAQGQTTAFTVTPIAGYTASVASSCGGSLSGATFTTAAITADCSVQASFALTVVVPDPPQISVATPGNMQVELTVIPPMFDGGAPITSYVFTCGGISVTSSTIRATVTGLPNFAPAMCFVVAVNSAGNSPASPTVTVTPLPPLELLSAVSRKTHGAAGDFDLPIVLGVPINGAVTVEPRANLGTHRLILTVNIPVSTGMDAELTDDQNNNIGISASATGQGNTITVNLSGVQNRKRARLTLSNINGSETTQLTMGFLIGDVNGNGAINGTDVSAIKARAGAGVANDNFLYDINLTGKITGADIATVKARSGTSLP
ncbi:MAG: ExeM/NucH family extracellular endonuclease, partial [Betaproteobacteria bacterium]|nr:ExeM/NucH family extracellular endonuclease [Betaproteobacteria bacterium]